MNPLAIAVAALMTFLIGAPWYSPLMFLKPWARESGIDPDAPPNDRPKPKRPAVVFGAAYVASLFAVAALSYGLGPHPGLARGVLSGAATGVCIVASSFAVNYAFGSKSLKLWLIDAGYHVVQFTGFGLVLGFWP